MPLFRGVAAERILPLLIGIRFADVAGKQFKTDSGKGKLTAGPLKLQFFLQKLKELGVGGLKLVPLVFVNIFNFSFLSNFSCKSLEKGLLYAKR